jgi:release factor glutamine methyltransferase
MENVLQHIHSELKGIYPESEIQSIGYLLLEKLTGFSRTEILLNKNTQISREAAKQLDGFLKKLKNYEPVQYVLESTEFYGLSFKVNQSVLIPRPETEELVEWICLENDRSKPVKMLDIGTGSGCIAISLKKNFPLGEVDAFDISPEALDVAGENAKLNQVNVNFREIDIFNPPAFNKKWDLIVSNPPYVPESEKSEMHRNVTDYEPSLALFVPDDDPLRFYRTIANFARKNLTIGGKLYFEIHYQSGNEMLDLLAQCGFRQLTLKKDISGKDRMIRGIF